jgi:hypothetical protein
MSCKRCGHPQHWHTHDDTGCLSNHFQPCYPEGAPFRCIGYDAWKSGYPLGTPETRCGCPDYVAETGLADTPREAKP